MKTVQVRVNYTEGFVAVRGVRPSGRSKVFGAIEDTPGLVNPTLDESSGVITARCDGSTDPESAGLRLAGKLMNALHNYRVIGGDGVMSTELPETKSVGAVA